MKLFIVKIVKVLLSFVMCIFLFVISLHCLRHEQLNYKLDKEKEYLIMGHSHPEQAFDDGIILKCKNLAKSAENYFFTYQKIKEISGNHHIKAIFIEYSNNVLTSGVDQWLSNFDRVNKASQVHSPFMSLEDIIYLYRRFPKEFIQLVSTSTRVNLIDLILQRNSFKSNYGGFTPNTVSNIDSLLTEQKQGVQRKEEELLDPNESILYLIKILDYCSEIGIKTFLIRSPQHLKFSRSNEEQLRGILKNELKNVAFLDFDRFPLLDEEYADFGHLNQKGAVVFSTWFNTLLENGLLQKDNKAEMVKVEIEKFRKKREGEND
ncbi:hypothetical protein [Membranihabitans marinus]|uniref:hypothetical protein n=1 Tax=Membranihabitans marinus TaxID=1227546 RepID=UPI001F382B94|nr:hypothetical protein [Membranihabitans marinus]